MHTYLSNSSTKADNICFPALKAADGFFFGFSLGFVGDLSFGLSMNNTFCCGRVFGLYVGKADCGDSAFACAGCTLGELGINSNSFLLSSSTWLVLRLFSDSITFSSYVAVSFRSPIREEEGQNS